MARTIEDLDEEYKGREEDTNYLNQQAVLGSREDAKRAYDKDGKFHCINWFDCQYCPAFDPNHCL